ncbi:MAG: DUF819 domain-containing protein [Bacilli bacterium]
MFGLWENTLVSPDNTSVMLAIITTIAAISIILEQKYEWASKVTGAVIALLGAMILSNLKVIPIGSGAENMVWGYVVPLAIPMLLFRANIVKIWKESGKLLIIYLISAVGTLIGGIVAVLVLGNLLTQNAVVGDNVEGLVAMMSGSYTGGSVNFAAMADSYNVTGTALASAAVVADNLLMVLYFFVLISFASFPLMRKIFKHPHIDEVESGTSKKAGQTQAASFWGRKEVSLKDIALVFAIAFSIVAFSQTISDLISANIVSDNIIIKIVFEFLGNKYLIITTFTLLVATIFSKQFENIRGSNEIGTFLIYTFFVVIGIPASIPEIINNAPILLVFAFIMVAFNMLITFICAKLFKFTLEESILASNANIGGPTTAAAIAISKGWTSLIAPVMLVGTLGYVLGNYVGLIVGNIAKILGY